MRRLARPLIFLLALISLFAGATVMAASYHTDIRVLLSIGKNQSFSFTPVGEFTLLEDDSIKISDGEELTLTRVGSRVSLTVDGKTVTAASLTLINGDYEGRVNYIRLKHSSYGNCTYLGNMRFDVSGGYIRAVNTLPLEYYLYGVVPHEMSNSFPIDALKAQAVCARGYAMSRCSKNAESSYDIRDTSQDQVYRGYASKNTRAIAAVDDTKGQVLTYEDDVIEAYYSASNGGQTERTGNVWENDLPYYVNADDPYDLENPSSLEDTSFIPAKYDENTRALMDAQVLLALERGAMEKAGCEVELISTVSVIPTEPTYDEPSRCYQKAIVTLIAKRSDDGKEGEISVELHLSSLDFGSYDNQLGSLSAKKTKLRMRGAEPGKLTAPGGESYSGWLLTVRRYGHGIGLSQRAAQQRARDGQSYLDILSFYFVNTGICTVGDYKSAPKVESGKYSVKSWGLSGVSPETEAGDLLNELSSKAEMRVVSSRGKAKESGASVCTGNFVRLIYDDGKKMYDLPVVIYGDLNGDGKIGQDDVASLQKHLLRSTVFTGAYLHAADVDHNGKVDSEDLLLLIRCIQGDGKIRQEG